MSFRVTSKSSQREWSVNSVTKTPLGEDAEYIPTYTSPQLFRWRGHWLEVQGSSDTGSRNNTNHMDGMSASSSIVLT